MLHYQKKHSSSPQQKKMKMLSLELTVCDSNQDRQEKFHSALAETRMHIIVPN